MFDYFWFDYQSRETQALYRRIHLVPLLCPMRRVSMLGGAKARAFITGPLGAVFSPPNFFRSEVEGREEWFTNSSPRQGPAEL